MLSDYTYAYRRDRPGEIHCFNSLNDYVALFNSTIQLNGIEMTGNFTDQQDLNALFAQADLLQQNYVQTAQMCVSSNGDTLKYVGSAATVRDMVGIADALEGATTGVNYFGISHGTVLGNLFLNSEFERIVSL